MTDKKIALITGASRGIGQACLLQLAEQGCYVIGTATTEKGAQTITQLLAGMGLSGEGKVLNLSLKDSIQALHDELKASSQLPQIMVNNAGITRDNLLLRMSDEQWHEVVNTNLTGVFHMCKIFSKPMLKQRWGRIINISSVSALMGNPGQCNYAAAKAGVIGFSKSLAAEIAMRNITVNVVAPGFINTDMTQDLPAEQREAICKNIPMGRMGKPEEIASVVAMLASDGASYITGETIQVSGGLL
jgi:3-oxoacyl-[acyl-carrier protein] reductase